MNRTGTLLPPMVQPLDDESLRRALDMLAGSDIDLAQALARLGYPESRQRTPGFATLVHIIAGQQVSTASGPPPSAASWR